MAKSLRSVMGVSVGALYLGLSLGCGQMHLPFGGSTSGHGAAQGASDGPTVNIQPSFDTAGGTVTPSPTPPVPGVTPPPASDCYKAAPSICQIESRILALTNGERASPTGGFFRQSAKKPLGKGPKLSFVAREWSGVQAQRGDIGHDGFPEQRVQMYSQEFHTQPQVNAENVAMSGALSAGGATLSAADVESVAQEFFTMWKNSPGHYANMMGDYDAMGVGVYFDASNGWYATEIFGDD